MKNTKKKFVKIRNILTIITVALIYGMTVSSCESGGVTSKVKSFDYRLWGTWESNDKTRYTGTLVINNDRITITGYDANQTPRNGNDNERPFKQFPKERAMKGYSEEGKFFIVNGDVTESIPYYYWEDNPPPSYNLVQYLRFNFGGRNEDLDYKGQ
ncbi:MAG: hypothetical protein FWF68_08515 [Spirochaetes bacterium]|nr:hypothetical protein [Spirochaetota bacterium]